MLAAPMAPPRRRLAPLDAAAQRRHKLRNLAQSGLLLAGIGLLLAACGWILFGPGGLLGLALGAVLAFLLSPSVAPAMVLRMYRAARLQPAQLPEVFQLLDALSRRAGLARSPELYYVPSAMLNAFAVGRPDAAAIGITDGLLRTLDLRELAGVLAHELSHVRNNDLWLMGLADVAARLTRTMSLFGMVLTILSLPWWLAGGGVASFLLLLLLLFAPQLTTLLQLALSRAREYDADLDAAGLTGDPAGLIAALRKLDRQQRGFWEQIFLPGRQLPQPSLLRSHPPTDERVARLQALYAGDAAPEPLLSALGLATPIAPTPTWPRIQRAPRGRLIGYWY
jgi:heat shock protein HtpX